MSILPKTWSPLALSALFACLGLPGIGCVEADSQGDQEEEAQDQTEESSEESDDDGGSQGSEESPEDSGSEPEKDSEDDSTDEEPGDDSTSESGDSSSTGDDSDTGSDSGDSGGTGDEDGEDESDDDDCPPHPKGPECAATDLRGKLECIPGLKILKGQGSSFTVTLQQPVDHKKPDGATFPQTIKIQHKGFDRPLIFHTTGYSGGSTRHEITQFISANVIDVEHRYFGSSKPSGKVDWSTLTIKAAADDFHRIYENFKWMYPKAWVNTGASKGGETVLFHRRFHHCDVDATVAYVAPIVDGKFDTRFNDFFDTVGGDALKECRERLKSVQRSVLRARDQFLPSIPDSNFSVIGGASVALEHQVVEFPFTFFQTNGSRLCSQVPQKSASAEEKYRYMSKIHPVSRAADSEIRRMLPFFVQTTMELGWPSASTSAVQDLIQHPNTYLAEHYLPNKDLGLTFDPNAMQDIRDWMGKKGRRIMLIYGEYDPWTAAKLDLGDAKDSFSYTVPKGSHSANLRGLPRAQKDKAVAHLRRWLGQ